MADYSNAQQPIAELNAEQPYRTLVEEMQEGAAILTVAGDIVYCNRQFSTLVAIPLENVVHRAVAVCGERQVDQRLEVNTQPVWIEGDLVRVEQIVNNIVGNAVKYTPAGGSIRVCLDSDGGNARLRVEDTGYGIATELLPRVFDLFVQGERTLERAQGGLGIGLTLGGIARRHRVGVQRGPRMRQRLHREVTQNIHASSYSDVAGYAALRLIRAPGAHH